MCQMWLSDSLLVESRYFVFGIQYPLYFMVSKLVFEAVLF